MLGGMSVETRLVRFLWKREPKKDCAGGFIDSILGCTILGA